MATKRQIFYSFHYKLDNWRVAKVRNIGAIEGNRPASDNDWEEIVKAGDIKGWIDEQMKQRSCTIVLIGHETAKREWINYEIAKSWKNGMGVAGIYIHGIKNEKGDTSQKGHNPFDYVNFQDESKMSTKIKSYLPPGSDSKEKYAWIKDNIANIVEEAIAVRNE